MTNDPSRSPAAELSEQLQSPSYRLPVEDVDFLLREEMRGVRFALEYSKADLLLRDWGIRSTIIVFGSARAPSPEAAPELLAAAAAINDTSAIERIQRQVGWYEAARAFGRLVSKQGGAFAPRDRWRDNVIATGGGPGIMEAANRGASEIGAPSIGFNIMLPAEQRPNSYSTPALTFRFHYFAMRKMHLAMRANALAIFPGGFGTMDELFEMLTLRQTRKAPPIPIVLYGSEYWRRIINLPALADEGMITQADLDLFDYADTPEAVWECMLSRGLKAHSPNGSP